MNAKISYVIEVEDHEMEPLTGAVLVEDAKSGRVNYERCKGLSKVFLRRMEILLCPERFIFHDNNVIERIIDEV